MLNRRRFLKSLVAAAATPALAPAARADSLAGDSAFPPLRPDPDEILDLPAGFSYTIVSRAGTRMSDGFQVPPAHDGMGAFAGEDGRVILICNHEMESGFPEYSAFGTDFASLPETIKAKVYDLGDEVTPGAGGTTTTIYNPATREIERQFLSLAGTEVNCAGGPTPWGSWLSCEESFTGPGSGFPFGRKTIRNEQHGFVFEVPANATGLVEAVPLKSMGRFEHEAAAVHAASGAIYLSEDRHYSCFYRFLPETPGELVNGGTLQALAITGHPSMRTHNWASSDIEIGRTMPVHWNTLRNVVPEENDLRLRAAVDGAASFARGEGLTISGDDAYLTCTIGGPRRRGQIFAYTASPYEGTPREKEAPATLTLIAEATDDSLLQHADNLTMAPWGDLVVCEDDSRGHCGLVGVRSDGQQYPIADNAYSGSELAGVCFSPDGRTMFINIQYPGATLAITGPWPGAQAA